MSLNRFYFQKIQSLEVLTFDNSLEHFHDLGIEGTLREVLQNSIDAKLPGAQGPVHITIKVDEIHKSFIPGIDEVFAHIESLHGMNDYTTNKIKYMREKKTLQTIPVLTIEDENTRGLSGAKNGPEFKKKDSYPYYAYHKGAHYAGKQENYSSGGSHGIGKISANAISNIHLMYFANCDEDDYQSLGGSVQLIEHELNGQTYRSTGYYSQEKTLGNFDLYPFPNNNTPAVFRKNTRGMKIIIPYLQERYINLKKIVHALCDNFFYAYWNNDLSTTIEIEGRKVTIDHQSIETIVQDQEFFETDPYEINKNFSPLYINTLKTAKIEEININDYQFKLYFLYDEKIRRGRTALVRSMGMKINDLKIRNNAFRPYNAVLIGGVKEDEYLKTLENESHTSISYENIRDKKQQTKARRFINRLHNKMHKKIRAYEDQMFPTDGAIDTSELIYETIVHFEEAMGEEKELIEIKGGPKISTSGGKRERRNPPQNPPRPQGGPRRQQVRRPKKLTDDPTGEHGEESVTNMSTIIAPPQIVERISFGNMEELLFDLSSIDETKHWSTVNLSFRVIDGEGKELNDEIDFTKSFKSIEDRHNLISLDFNNNQIFAVSISKRKLHVRLNHTTNYNPTLKYIYVIEGIN